MLKVYTAFDAKAEVWLEPWVHLHRANAMRQLEDLVNDPKTLFFKYPNDFTFFEIGEWDQIKGEIRPYPNKFSLGLALEFKRVESPSKDLLVNER